MNNNKKLTIKSAGVIDGEYKVILSNGAELSGVQVLEVRKDLSSVGVITLEVVVF